MLKGIARELKQHAPFTLLGTLSGVAIVILFVYVRQLKDLSEPLFGAFHSLHVLLSAVVTAAMYRLHTKARLLPTILIGYFGSVGIATISDCLIPFAGEWLLGLPRSHLHLGFIQEWWLVNPLALAGIALACVRPTTKVPHAGHVLLSMSASAFHMTMALGEQTTLWIIFLVPVFLFLAVWVPCCTSDIVFPLVLIREKSDHPHPH
jgi:hypothetical protein